MPDLSDLDSKVIIKHGLHHMFRGVGPHTAPAIGLVANFIRLVDKSVREYCFAWDALEEFVQAHRARLEHEELHGFPTADPALGTHTKLSPLFRVSDHLENCISAVKRAIETAWKIRRLQTAPHVGKDEISSKAAEERLTDFRDAFEHTADKTLRRHEIDTGEFVIPFTDGSVAYIGKHSLPLADLATWVRQLHALSVRLAAGKPPPD
jgi:hypothetical protein